MEIVLTNQSAHRQALLSALDTFARENHLAVSVRQAADLALEEHVTNVMRYAYQDASRHEIRVRIGLEENYLVVEIEDDGKAFDPLSLPEVDTSLPLDQKPIGGLGIHLIRKCMDEVRYRREANKNILHLRKRLSG